MDNTAPGADWRGINVSPVLSAFFWGALVSIILSGISILQAYIYFPSKDRIAIQLVALTMIVFDIVSTCLISQGLYSYVIPMFGSLIPLESLHPVLAIDCVFSSLIVFISQLYFSWQIYIVMARGKSSFKFSEYAVVGSVIIFAIAALIGGLGCSAVMLTQKDDILSNRSFHFLVYAGIARGASTVADIIATAALCLFLGLSRTGIKDTDSLLKALMQLIVQRGVLVTFIQAAFLILLFASPHTYWLALHINVTKLYVNTFFAMLNGREHLHQKRNATHMSMSHMDTESAVSRNISFMHTPSSVENKTFNMVTIDKTVVIADI